MTNTALGLQALLDEREIRTLALRYAQAADRRDPTAWVELFTPDAAIEGSGVALQGLDRIAAIPQALASRYQRTYHTVLNHLITLNGDEAQGEVYSQAHHLSRQDDGRTSDYIMAITYRDRYVRRDGEWRFQHREIDLQWTQTLWVDPEAKVG